MIGMTEKKFALGDVREKIFGALKSDAAIMIAVYAAALVLHILITGAATIFNLTPDEYSVTAIAAYLNGLDWSSTVSTGGYYGYFQSLFYVPVFRITDDPYLRYRLMLIINGVLMSFVPVIAYWLTRRVFEIEKPASAVFSLICGLYPSYMLLTNFTWNETMCCLLPWVFLLILFNAYSCRNAIKKQVLSCLGGLVSIAAYAAHGRMLSLVAAGIVLEIIVFLTVRERSPDTEETGVLEHSPKRVRIFCFSGFFGGTVAGLIIDKMLKRYFQSVLWNVGSGRSAPINTIEKMTSQLFGENGNFSIARFFQTLIGHFFYFFSSTWGFGAVCVISVIASLIIYYRRKIGKTNAEKLPNIGDKTAVLCWFVLLITGAAFAVSVLFKCTSSSFDRRMDTTIYGRYTESVYPLAILCTLVIIYKFGITRLQAVAAFISNAVVTALTQIFTVPIVINSETFVSAMVLGLAPMRYGEGLRDLYDQTTFIKIYLTVFAASVLWLAIAFIGKLKKYRVYVFCIPLAVAMIYSGTIGYMTYTVPQAKNAKRGADIMTAAVDRLNGEFNEITLFAMPRDRYVKTQFLYPEMKIKIASSVSVYRKPENKSEIVLANIEETPELWFDELRLVGSLNDTVHIYAASENAYRWALENGYTLGESGMIVYSSAELKTSSDHVQTNYNDNAGNIKTALSLAKGGSAYTNYTHLQKGTYTFTVYASESGNIAISADKGKTELPFEITESGGICAKLTVKQKTENVRFTFTNNSDDPINIEKIVIRRVK